MYSLYSILLKHLSLFHLICAVILFSVIDVNSQWENKHGNLPQWGEFARAIDALDSLTAMIAFSKQDPPYDTGLYLTIDGGITWQILNFDQPRRIWDFSMVDTNNIWVCASYPCIILATSDGGETWNKQLEVPDSVSSFLNYIKMFDINNGIAMGDAPYPLLGKPAPFFKTTDGGMNWISVSNSFINGSSEFSWRPVDFVTPDIGFFIPYYWTSYPFRIYKTIDGALSWNEMHEAYGHSTVLKFNDQNYGVAQMFARPPGSGEYIIRTTDAGNSWDSTLMSTTNLYFGVDFEFIKNNPAKIWYAGIDKLYFSADSGRSWVKDPLQILRAEDLVIVDGNVCWFLCETVYRNLNADKITAVKDDQKIIDDFRLSQNYPNPFNPLTNIDYEIKELSLVIIKVYDILGREAAVLVNEEKSPGKYSVQFNASHLSSGVYFYKLTSGGNTVVKNMLLLK